MKFNHGAQFVCHLIDKWVHKIVRRCKARNFNPVQGRNKHWQVCHFPIKGKVNHNRIFFSSTNEGKALYFEEASVSIIVERLLESFHFKTKQITHIPRNKPLKICHHLLNRFL